MTTVKHYRIYCTTEASFQYVWSTTAPTVCPNNNTHTVDTSSITVVETISSNIVKVQEEFGRNTGGRFGALTVRIDAVKNATTTKDCIWPIPISALSVRFVLTSIHEGDFLSIIVSPDTIIGNITSNVTAEATWVSQNYVVDDVVLYSNKTYKCILDTVSNEDPTNTTYWEYVPLVINVSQTVIDNVVIGIYLGLFDGVQNNNLGRIIAIDTTNLTVSMEYANTDTFSALSPTYVRMTLTMFQDFELGPPGNYPIGDSAIGGSYIPANTIVRASYNNQSLIDDKVFIGIVEYLY